MRNPFLILVVFVATFMLSSSGIAAPPEEKAAEEAKASEEAPDTVAEEAKASEEKAVEEAKAPPDKPAVLKDDDAAVAAVKTMIDAARNGHWSMVAALAIMLVVFVVGRLGLVKKLGKNVVPWIAAGTGVLGYIAAALMVEGTPVLDAVTGGFVIGAAAVGLWEMLFKHLLKANGTSEPQMKP